MRNTSVTFQCQCCNHIWTMEGEAITGKWDRLVVGDEAGGSLLCQRTGPATGGAGGCGMCMAKVVAVVTDEPVVVGE